MKLTSLAILIALATGAVAQTPKPKQTTPPPKPAAAKVAPAAKKTAAQKPAPKAPAKAQPAAKTPAKVASKPAVPAKPTAAKAESKTPEMARAGRRDPFISPVRLQEERMRSNPACTTGARCLIISQVVLKGVVKTQNGMIAMVENAAKKQYNLHERDTVQNGSVVKITGDSIIFQENITDPLGRQVTKEVVKRVTVPAV
jgi:Tfp pilus assembly protein PilP